MYTAILFWREGAYNKGLIVLHHPRHLFFFSQMPFQQTIALYTIFLNQVIAHEYRYDTSRLHVTNSPQYLHNFKHRAKPSHLHKYKTLFQTIWL